MYKRQASLAVAMRPQLFGLGAAPLALAGLMPRSVFRSEPEDPIPALLGSAVATAARWGQDDLETLHRLSLIHISEPTRPY